VNDRDQIRSTSEEDAATESAVLKHVLALHPTVLTLAELIRELDGEGEGFTGRDAIERAVHDLIGVGLLHRNEAFVMPTRAALRLDELLGE
jgi:hypothetical protein